MKIKMGCSWMAGAAILTMATLSSPADESSTAAAGPEKTYTGTVLAVHPNQQTMRVRGWFLSKDFNIGNSCEFALWGQPAGALTDLRPGEKVTVSYQASNGVWVADRVKEDLASKEGTVQAVNPTDHSITLRDHGMDKTFKIADDCAVVLRDNHSGFISDVQPGDLVTVIYDTPDGHATARQIAQTSATFTGTLTAIDLESKTLKVKSMFETKSFDVGSQCAIVLDGKMGGQLSNLRPDEPLVINYDDVNGVNIVNRIATAPPAQTETTTSMRTVP
ncbi:MAG TPA: hypothetical protein VMH30_13040 [Verrucomicrobiae bacterium]|nr:hypothetical protein [Verrucomicrobiae bacterium]